MEIFAAIKERLIYLREPNSFKKLCSQAYSQFAVLTELTICTESRNLGVLREEQHFSDQYQNTKGCTL